MAAATPLTGLKSWYCSPEAFKAIGPMGEKGYYMITAPKIDTERVAEWYLQNPVSGYAIRKVEIIHNPEMVRRFEAQMALLAKRQGNPAFQPSWEADCKNSAEKTQCVSILQLLEKMSKPYQDPERPQLTILPGWHGTKPSILSSIFETGYANLATTDPGFFGRGIYSAGEAAYASSTYSKGALLVNWIVLYSAFPVIKNDMDGLQGKGNHKNYDAHFIPVVPANLTILTNRSIILVGLSRNISIQNLLYLMPLRCSLDIWLNYSPPCQQK